MLSGQERSKSSNQMGVVVVWHQVCEHLPILEVVWVDRTILVRSWLWPFNQCVVTVCEVRHRTDDHNFEVLPQRWRVEHTRGWLNLYWLMSKDYGICTDHREGMIYCALI